MAKFAVLGDARRVVRFCRKHGVRAVLNGHRHLSYQLRLPNRTVLMAAPSSTLGDELAHDPRPQFERYHLAPFVEEPTVGIYREVFRIPLSVGGMRRATAGLNPRANAVKLGHMPVTRKILKVGNSRALVLDKTIAAALGLGPDTTEIPIAIEEGKVTLLPPESQDPFDALRVKLAKYSESEARRIAADEVAAVRSRTIRRWKAAK